ncbi:MAG TPA: SpoIIE family protein phosphatase [Bryobacteraceae bacterium]|nr:SpoIIE family protein phosphatase [Bryobacteraceae bacterium]
MDPAPIPYLAMHAVNIYVRDQERSLRFYVDQLGFTVAFDARLQSGERWLAVAPPDGTAVLSLIAPKPESRESKLIGRSTQILFVTEDVLAKFHEWRLRGVRFQSTPRLRRVQYPGGAENTPVWGGVFARFRDVDGNTFVLAGFDAISRKVQAERQARAARLEAERRAAQELEIAKQVQARLFPQMRPSLATLEYAGVCIQARQVGGDYYDFLDLGRGRYGFVIGDIAGKGMAAALLMANLQANLRSQCAIADDPECFLRSVNRLFYNSTSDGAFATLFFAQYDDRTRQMRYVNCGHLCGLLLHLDDTIERLDSTCLVLGILPELECPAGECRLAPGDLLALYTDGVTESRNAADEEYGEQRLIDALCAHRREPAEELVASVVQKVQAFNSPEQHDDITLIVARCG